jgi:hypothetical protein
MTTPFYRQRYLQLPTEKYAEIAIDGGLWLAGEFLAQSRVTKCDFVPDVRNIHKPLHLEAARSKLCQIDEKLRHRIFIVGFLMMPDTGGHETFRRLLVTHNKMLHDAMRLKWTERLQRQNMAAEVPNGELGFANEILHNLLLPR